MQKAGYARFLYHRKLRKIDLAVLLYSGAAKTTKRRAHGGGDTPLFYTIGNYAKSPSPFGRAWGRGKLV